jgi:hypothetical protein
MSKPSDLLQGTLDFIILQTLRWGPRHGYGLVQMIRASSNNSLQVETGSLYPALHKLEQKAGSARSGSRRKTIGAPNFILPTRLGKHLSKEADQWDRLSSARSSPS